MRIVSGSDLVEYAKSCFFFVFAPYTFKVYELLWCKLNREDLVKFSGLSEKNMIARMVCVCVPLAVFWQMDNIINTDSLHEFETFYSWIEYIAFNECGLG